VGFPHYSVFSVFSLSSWLSTRQPHLPRSRPLEEKEQIRSIIFIIILVLISFTWAVFADWDFNALRRKTLAQVRALNYSWETLRGIHGEDFGEAGREYGGFAGVDGGHRDGVAARAGVRGGRRAWNTDVDEGEAESD
jgi:hypothetical protein